VWLNHKANTPGHVIRHVSRVTQGTRLHDQRAKIRRSTPA
jgi:hypothetical protein